VLIAKRFKDTGRKSSCPVSNGRCRRAAIDEGEDPRPAAQRELYEETGRDERAISRETPDCHLRVPPYAARLIGRCVRGQRQKWFAFRFFGNRSAKSW